MAAVFVESLESAALDKTAQFETVYEGHFFHKLLHLPMHPGAKFAREISNRARSEVPRYLLHLFVTALPRDQEKHQRNYGAQSGT